MDGAAIQGCRRQRWGGAGLAVLRCPRHGHSRAQQPRTPFRSPPALAGGSADYPRWDAAYVLGSLSRADRREFEAHLSTCPSCREGVTELSVMPALLAQLSGDDVAGMDEGGPGVLPPLSPPL
jgi:Putative zinc-finger